MRVPCCGNEGRTLWLRSGPARLHAPPMACILVLAPLFPQTRWGRRVLPRVQTHLGVPLGAFRASRLPQAQRLLTGAVGAPYFVPAAPSGVPVAVVAAVLQVPSARRWHAVLPPPR